MERKLVSEQITAFEQHLWEEERSPGTVEKYLRDVRAFACWLDGRAVTKETVTGWKEYLLAEHRAPSTLLQVGHEQVDDLRDLGFLQRLIEDDLVEAVEELGAELLLEQPVHRLA